MLYKLKNTRKTVFILISCLLISLLAWEIELSTDCPVFVVVFFFVCDPNWIEYPCCDLRREYIVMINKLHVVAVFP